MGAQLPQTVCHTALLTAKFLNYAFKGSLVSITAGIGILINGFTAWLLMAGSSEDINVKASFLHMISDTLVSIGVVISGIIISVSGFYLIDPIISLGISVVVFVLAVQLLFECLKTQSV